MIAFIRTLPPVARDVPRSQLNFPFNLIVRTMPSPAPPLREKAPDPSNRLEYGKYLTTMALVRRLPHADGARAPRCREWPSPADWSSACDPAA